MLLNRGIHCAPWQGESRELVLIAVTARGTLLREPVLVALGGDAVAAADALWDELDAKDPVVIPERQAGFRRRGCLEIVR